MSVMFRPAVRENASIIMMIAGSTGSGKTYSALKIATGLGGRIAVIDTESGRATHYADAFKFDHFDMKPPFSPAAYREAVEAADKAGYSVVVIDSFTHEHSGDGGTLDMHEAELQRMAGDDWKKREACKMAAWIKPKTEHKRMLSKFLQCRCHIIMCFRASEKMKMEKIEGKMVPIPIGWQPDAEKGLPYEATVSVLLTPDAPGVPKSLKIQEQHKKMFPLDRPISEDCGIALTKWARGGSTPASAGITEPDRTHLRSQPAAGEGDNPAAPDAAQAIHDDIIKFLGATSDPARIREAWSTDVNVPTLKSADAVLYERAYNAMRQRLKELRA